MSDQLESQMCGKNCMKSHVSTSTPFGFYINKRQMGGVCELLDRRGRSHGNVVQGPRALNGESFRSKPKKKYISIKVHRVCVFGCVAMCMVCGVWCASVRVCECVTVCTVCAVCVRVHICVRLH